MECMGRPTTRKYRKQASDTVQLIHKCGVVRMVEGWVDDAPQGQGDRYSGGRPERCHSNFVLRGGRAIENPRVGGSIPPLATISFGVHSGYNPGICGTASSCLGGHPLSSQANTPPSLVDDLVELGVRPGAVVMVHSSLREIGWTIGGPVTVIRALLEVLGSEGTLVMPAESPQMSDPADWNDDRAQTGVVRRDSRAPASIRPSNNADDYGCDRRSLSHLSRYPQK